MDETTFIDLVEELMAIGADKDELNYWIDCWHLLDDATRKEIYENYSAELATRKGEK